MNSNNATACKTSWPYADEPSLVLINKVRAKICMRLTKDSTNPFFMNNEMQYTTKLFNLNSLVLSILMLLMVCSENCAQSLIIYASKHVKVIMGIDNIQTWTICKMRPLIT